MEDLNTAGGRMHKVTMSNRRTCGITGVNDVLSFDDQGAGIACEQADAG